MKNTEQIVEIDGKKYVFYGKGEPPTYVNWRKVVFGYESLEDYKLEEIDTH
jgi:hypothetical protein